MDLSANNYGELISGHKSLACKILLESDLFRNTPWKINGWNLQITHEKKGT